MPIPAHHEVMVKILTALSALGGVPWLYGLVVLDVWATVFGLCVMILTKTWFVDRMVWLYDDVKKTA